MCVWVGVSARARVCVCVCGYAWLRVCECVRARTRACVCDPTFDRMAMPRRMAHGSTSVTSALAKASRLMQAAMAAGAPLLPRLERGENAREQRDLLRIDVGCDVRSLEQALHKRRPQDVELQLECSQLGVVCAELKHDGRQALACFSGTVDTAMDLRRCTLQVLSLARPEHHSGL